MARLALAVGYTSRTNARSEEHVQLYLGSSFQAAKDAAQNPPDGIGYAEAYRLDAAPTKRFHRPAAAPVAPAPAPVLDLLPDPPAAEETAAPAEDSAAGPEAGEEPDLDLGTPGRKRGGKA